MSDDANQRYRQGQLAKRIQDETGGILDAQEHKIIQQVMAKLNSGETLDPQFAIQQWLELYSVQRFRRVLSQRERQSTRAGAELVTGAETLTGPHNIEG